MLPLSVIFCGTPEFACPSLEALHRDPAFRVTHVITQPDRPMGRGKKLTPPPVKELAEKLGIPVLQPENINDEQGTHRPKLTADFLVTVAYGEIFSPALLQIPRIAPVNVHASLLPKLRGASPIEQCLLNGEKETGVTIQRMVERLDAGPILAQERIAIAERETAVSLREKLSKIAAHLLPATLKAPLAETPQEESEATYCHKLTKADGEVDPERMTAVEIDRRIRALVPWPGVTTLLSDKPVKLLSTALVPALSALALPCKGQTMLYVTKLQVAGKQPITGEEWERGYLRKNPTKT